MLNRLIIATGMAMGSVWSCTWITTAQDPMTALQGLLLGLITCLSGALLLWRMK